jgi:hypothetical protein
MKNLQSGAVELGDVILITARLPSFSVSAGRFFIALFVAATPEINEHDLSLSH